LIIWANGHTLTSGGKLLATRPVVFVGLISYSLYLWHWPVLVFFKYWQLGPVAPGRSCLLLLASIILAALSWKFIEIPIRKRLVFQKRWQIFSAGGLATAILLAGGLAVFESNGVPARMPAAALQYLAGSPVLEGNTNRIICRQLSLRDARSGNFDEFGQADKKLPVGLLVWGDSHAQVELPILDMLCKEHSVRGVAATHSQTAPLVGFESKGVWSLGRDSVSFNDAVVEFIRRSRVSNVLIIARWDYYVNADKGTGRLRQGLLATVRALQDSGATIWIMRQVPSYPWDVPRALASAVLHGHDPEDLGLSPAEQREQSQHQDPIFASLTTATPKVMVLDPTALFEDASGRCRVAKDGKPLYFDSDHVNVAGALMLRPLFEPIFGGVGQNGIIQNVGSGVETAFVAVRHPFPK
jgi:hypothetical protein